MAEILFVCVHNAGRSQMAKAMFNRIASERGLAVRAESAGTEPGEGVHDIVATAMQEMGFDLRVERPQLLTDEMVEQAQRVVTMGCAIDSEACPAIFLRDVEDWGLPDPKGQPIEEVRAIRDVIGQKVEDLLSELTPRD